jgi:hypothetical protein
MRVILAILSVAAIVATATPSLAEKRLFIIANNPDGYGLDRCLASGAACGTAAATAYCTSQQFHKALSFRKVDRDDITGAIPASTGCSGLSCEEFVAIECGR